MIARFHDDGNKVILEWPMPPEWRPYPEIIRVPTHSDLWPHVAELHNNHEVFFFRRGVQDGISYYWTGITRTLPEDALAQAANQGRPRE